MLVKVHLKLNKIRHGIVATPPTKYYKPHLTSPYLLVLHKSCDKAGLKDVRRHCARLDGARPADHGRGSNAPLVERPLVSEKSTGGVEELVRMTTLQVCAYVCGCV